MANKTSNPRAYPDRPWVGVGVVIFKGDEVLLAERAMRPHGRMWSIPGGGQELGETVFEAGIREIREETGLEIRIGGLVDVVDVIDRDDKDGVRFHYTLVDLYAEWVSGEAVADDDVSAVKWVRFDALHEIELRDITRAVIEKAYAMRRDDQRP